MKIFFSGLLLLLLSSFHLQQATGNKWLAYEVDPTKTTLAFYYRNDAGKPLYNFRNLTTYLHAKGQSLVFAMNAGMYTEARQPLGLYIEGGKELVAINRRKAAGNFYIEPNGIFFINDKQEATICSTNKYPGNNHVQYATQSGPMLLIDGNVHSSFDAHSRNLNIRNGVGILPNQHVLLAMSKEPVSLYDFALFFQQQGCRNALYLDGFVSRTYWPAANWVQTDGAFGAMIGVTALQ